MYQIRNVVSVLTLFLIVNISLPAYSGNQSQAALNSEAFSRKYHVHVHYKLAHKFVVFGELWVGRSDEFRGILPAEAFEKLYFKSKSNFKLIKNLNDLSNHVRIHTRLQAIDFVNLLTSQDTFSFFNKNHRIELSIDPSAIYQTQNSIKLPRTFIRNDSGGFLVKRPLYVLNLINHKDSVIYIDEYIKFNGNYAVLHKSDLGAPQKFGLRQSIPASF